MNFELRIIVDCPNSAPARELFLRALDAEGLDAAGLRVRELDSEHEAKALEFHGSPTFIAAGEDLFASAVEPALTCRVCPSAAVLSGLPALADLRAALRSANDGHAN